jgi:hypothetical protein
MTEQDGRHAEDKITAAIEHQTAKLPSTVFLGLAIGSMVASAILKLAGKNHTAIFVGQWAAPLLLLGTYNKLVKQHGSNTTAEHRPTSENFGSQQAA